MPDRTLACRVDAFTPEQRERYQHVRAALKGALAETKELPDGYEFRYAGAGETFRLAAEFVTLERRCCPFFDFALEWTSEGQPALRITGGEGVKAFVREMLV
jgi:hypothetical protein